jgi:hypothetical protein
MLEEGENPVKGSAGLPDGATWERVGVLPTVAIVPGG